MKHCSFFLLVGVLLLLSSCRKEDVPLDPYDATRMEGQWRLLLSGHPDWQYGFHEGILTQSVTDFGVPITTLQFPYAVRRDTLQVGGDASNLPRTYKVYLHCDSIAEMHNISPGAILAPVVWLKRIR